MFTMIILSSVIVDTMKETLLQLGFSEKSAEIYLRLIELGTQPASVIAQRLGYPKSTVLFLMDEMERRGIVRKTTKSNTQYFSADITDLEAALQRDINSQNQALKSIVPLLHQIQ